MPDLHSQNSRKWLLDSTMLTSKPFPRSLLVFCDVRPPLSRLAKAEASLEEPKTLDRWKERVPVLCIPGPSLLDEAVALVVAHLVSRNGIGARAEKTDALSLSRFMSWETAGVEVVCLCHLATATSAQIRYAIRRIRRRLPTASIVVASLANLDLTADDEIAATAKIVQQSVRDTVDKIIVALVGHTAEKPSVGKPAASTYGAPLAPID